MVSVHLAATCPDHQRETTQQPPVAYLEIIMAWCSVELMSAHHPKPDLQRHAIERLTLTQLGHQNPRRLNGFAINPSV
jgi:hypothetical protein